MDKAHWGEMESESEEESESESEDERDEDEMAAGNPSHHFHVSRKSSIILEEYEYPLVLSDLVNYTEFQ